MEPNGYYWYTELDDNGALICDCVCVINDYFATLLLPGGLVVNNRLVTRMDGRLVPLVRPPMIPVEPVDDKRATC